MVTGVLEHRAVTTSLAEKAAFFIDAVFVNGFNLKMKADSRLMKLIGWVLALVGNRGFMDQFWTTVGYTVYRPSKANIGAEWQVIWHEGRHALQAKKLTRPLMAFLYLLPLSLIPFVVLGAILSPWALVAIPVLLLPLPAYYRMKMEVEAYKTSMLAGYHANGPSVNMEFYVQQFTGANYYWMWPFPSDIRRRIERSYNEIRIGGPMLDDYDRVMIMWIETNGLKKES